MVAASPRMRWTSVEVLLDDPGRPEHLPGRGRVADGLISHTVLLVPGRGVPVQLRQTAGLLLVQAGAEQVGEQVVKRHQPRTSSSGITNSPARSASSSSPGRPRGR